MLFYSAPAKSDSRCQISWVSPNRKEKYVFDAVCEDFDFSKVGENIKQPLTVMNRRGKRCRFWTETGNDEERICKEKYVNEQTDLLLLLLHIFVLLSFQLSYFVVTV